MSSNQQGKSSFFVHQAQRRARSPPVTGQVEGSVAPGTGDAPVRGPTAIFSNYSCKTQHQFINSADGTRGPNTACVNCGLTNQQLFTIPCSAYVEGDDKFSTIARLAHDKHMAELRQQELEEQLMRAEATIAALRMEEKEK